MADRLFPWRVAGRFAARNALMRHLRIGDADDAAADAAAGIAGGLGEVIGVGVDDDRPADD